jgi:hypothetical protein
MHKVLRLEVSFHVIWHVTFTILAIYVFNYLNIKFDDEKLELIFFAYGIFVASNFISHGIKEYFVFTNIIDNKIFFIKLMSALVFTFMIIFLSIIGNRINLIFDEETYNFVVVLSWLVMIIFITVVGEILGHVMISKGRQYLPLLARACPPIGLLIYSVMFDRIVLIEYFLLCSLHYVLIIILFIFGPNMSAKSDKEPVNLKNAVRYSLPFTISGGITYLVVATERTLWISSSSETYLIFQAYLMLQGGCYGVIIFPIINKLWGEYNNHKNNELAFNSLLKFQLMALLSAFIWLWMGLDILKLLFPSFGPERLQDVATLFGLYAFFIPLILNTLLSGRIFVSNKINKNIYAVDITSAFIVLIFCMACKYFLLWPGYIIIVSNLTVGVLMIIYWLRTVGIADLTYWRNFVIINSIAILGLLNV